MPVTCGADVLVVGLGNLLLCDDGVGVYAARALSGTPPEGAQVMEVGTNVLGALDAIERARAVVALDAVDAGRQPGTIVRFEISAAERRAAPESLHELDLAGALGLVPSGRMIRVIVLGVQPATLEIGISLSPPVLASLPRLLKAVHEEVSNLRRTDSQA